MHFTNSPIVRLEATPISIGPISSTWRASALDDERIVAKLGALDGCLQEPQQIALESYDAYQSISTRRATERLLQNAIEIVIDTCSLLVSELKLGVPGDEEDLIAKLESGKILSKTTADRVRGMKGFRNILVHQYGKVDDEIVYERARDGIEDFERFKQEVLEHLDRTC